MAESDRDLLAIQEDALLLDIVAARGDLTSFADDPIASVLGSWAADIDYGLESQPVSHLLAAPAPIPLSAPRRTRRSGRFMVAAGTAIALVGTSGVAAAVTGDPLLPFRAAVNVVTGSGHDTVVADGDGKGGHNLPDQAALEAQVNQSLSGVQKAIAAGDLELAQHLIDVANGEVDGVEGLPPGLQDRIDQLQQQIDHAVDNSGQGAGNPDHNNGQGDRGHQGDKGHQGAKGHHGDKAQNGGKADNTQPGSGTGKGQGTGHQSGKPGGEKSGKPNPDDTVSTGQNTDRANKPAGGGSTKGRPDKTNQGGGRDKVDHSNRSDKSAPTGHVSTRATR